MIKYIVVEVEPMFGGGNEIKLSYRFRISGKPDLIKTEILPFDCFSSYYDTIMDDIKNQIKFFLKEQ